MYHGDKEAQIYGKNHCKLQDAYKSFTFMQLFESWNQNCKARSGVVNLGGDHCQSAPKPKFMRGY